MNGKKNDKDKLRYDLITPEFLEDLAAVLTMGAKKYAANNWQQVDDAYSRYVGALYRHLEADRMGEYRDDESGLLHLAHVACNAMFLHYLRRKTDGGSNVRSDEDQGATMHRELRSIIEHCLYNDNEENSETRSNVWKAYRILDELRSYVGLGALNCHSTSDGGFKVFLGSNNKTSYHVTNVSESTLSGLQRLADRYIAEIK